LFALSTATLGQGFANRRIDIHPKYPSLVPLPGNRVSVVFSAGAQIAPNNLRMAEDGLKNLLSSSDTQLNFDHSLAQIKIRCSIINISYTWRNITLTRSEYKVVGSHTEYDQMAGTSKMVDDYGYVTVNYDAIAVQWDIEAEYEAVDLRSGLVFDSLPIQMSHAYQYEGYTPPDRETAHNWLLGLVVQRIAGQFTSRVAAVYVERPGRKMKEASKLIFNHRWDQARAQLEAMPALTNHRDESLRLYSIGLCFEAVAYDSNDWREAKKFLDQAVEYYSRARDLSPQTKEYWWAVGRTSDMAFRYKVREEQMKLFEETRTRLMEGRINADEAAQKVQDRPAPKPGHLAVWRGADALTNSTIIEWVKAGVPEKIIISTLREPGPNRFVLSPAEVSKLRQSGVSEKIIKAMRSAERSRGMGRKPVWLTVVLTLLPYAPLVFR
jgi:hypothetical protein